MFNFQKPLFLCINIRHDVLQWWKVGVIQKGMNRGSTRLSDLAHFSGDLPGGWTEILFLKKERKQKKPCQRIRILSTNSNVYLDQCVNHGLFQHLVCGNTARSLCLAIVIDHAYILELQPVL